MNIKRTLFIYLFIIDLYIYNRLNYALFLIFNIAVKHDDRNKYAIVGTRIVINIPRVE